MGDDCLSQYNWLTSLDVDNKAKEAEKKAWANFNQHFPNADKSKFEAQVLFDEKRNASAEIYFKAGPGHMINVFGFEKIYWSDAMKEALGVALGVVSQGGGGVGFIISWSPGE